MFNNFLKEYIKDLIDCGDNKKYNINKKDIENIVKEVENSEFLWEIIDNSIYKELDKYMVVE